MKWTGMSAWVPKFFLVITLVTGFIGFTPGSVAKDSGAKKTGGSSDSPAKPPAASSQFTPAAPDSAWGYLWAKLQRLQNPAAAKLAQDCLPYLSQFSQGDSGITKTLENNSDTFLKFSVALDDLRSRVSENEFSTDFGSTNWEWLERNFYSSLGVTNDLAENYRMTFYANLGARLSYLDTLARTYKAFILGDKLLAAAASSSMKNASNSLTTTTNANLYIIQTNTDGSVTISNVIVTTSKNITTTVSSNLVTKAVTISTNTSPGSTLNDVSIVSVLSFANAIRTAWDQSRNDPQNLTNVNKDLNDLYRAIDADTNSIAELLLVPTIGAGLDDASMLVLSNHVVKLRHSLATNFAATFCENTNLPANWKTNANMLVFYNACLDVFTNLMAPGTNFCDWWHEQQKMPKSDGTHPLDETIIPLLTPSEYYYTCIKNPDLASDTESSEKSAPPLTEDLESVLKLVDPPAVSINSVPPPTDEAVSDQGELITAYLNKHRRLKAAMVLEYIKRRPSDIDSIKVQSFIQISGENATNGNNALMAAANFNTDSLATSKITAANVSQLKQMVQTNDLTRLVGQLAGLQSQLEDLAGSISASATTASSPISLASGQSGGNGTNFFITFTNLLFNTNIFGPSFRNSLGKPLIAQSQVTAKLLGDLQGALKESTDYAQGQQNLYKNFFAEIVGARSQLNQEDLRHVTSLSLVVAKEIQRWTRLTALYKKYEKEFTLPNAGHLFNPAQPANLIPLPGVSWSQITTKSLILPTLRLLAYNVSLAQTNPPTIDPSGMTLISQQQRLVAAVQLLQGYFLMPSFNQRYAEENQRLLKREMDEHTIQILAINSVAHESEIRLMLGDQIAFQQTGLTQADLDNLVNLLETAGVFVIGAK